MTAEADGPDVEDPLREGVFRPDRLGRFGGGLAVESPPDGFDEVALATVLEEGLGPLLRDHARTLGGVEPELAAAVWTKRLATLLVPGPLASWTLWNVGLDLSPANLALQLDGTRPARCRIREPERVERDPQRRDRTLTSLFGRTLDPLFSAAAEAAQLPPRLAWTHVGNATAYLFDRLAEARELAARHRTDRSRLLDADEAAWGPGANPLQGTVRYERLPGDREPDAYQVRQVCCLKTRLPGRDPCASCPRLDADERARRLAERRAHR